MNIITRRDFVKKSLLSATGITLGSMMNVPGFLRPVAAGCGDPIPDDNKLLFVFLRGGNDALNTIIPTGDSAYNNTNRPSLYIPGPSTLSTNGMCDPGSDPARAMDLGNGFATLHPSLVDLCDLYNNDELALIHRVGYPKQSRSHFDSERYWETGVPNNDVIDEGLFYRTVVEGGYHLTRGLPAVTLQQTMPLAIRGDIPMANISDPARFDLLGVYAEGRQKHLEAIGRMHGKHYPSKKNRSLVFPTGERINSAIDQTSCLNFNDNGLDSNDLKIDGSPFLDASNSNAHLFPINSQSDDKEFSSSRAYNFFRSLKYSSQILSGTDAIITGTELSGFDTHNNQGGDLGGIDGGHADLMSYVGYALYGLKQYFSHPDINMWDKLVVVTMTEFGRTSIENGSLGTDHAEAGAMFLSGGAPALNGGTYQCDGTTWNTGPTGAMFDVSDRYLSRQVDYRSILGEVIRNHLGMSMSQLENIIPGYANPGERLQTGGLSDLDGTNIVGELGLFT